MNTMKKKKKGADDPPVNKNRSDTKNSKTPSAITSADNKSDQKKGSEGKEIIEIIPSGEIPHVWEISLDYHY